MKRQAATALAAIVLAGAALQADTLVMRDGRRVQGQLISVRDGVIEFEAQRGVFNRERARVDRADVLRIELDSFTTDRRDDDRDRDRRGDDRDRNQGDGGRPSGLRERGVNVSASQPWTDTGVTVRAGQTLYFDASGKVRWGPGRQDGPEGERNSPRNDRRPIGSRPAGALIGRIGEGDDYFFIGDDSGPIRVRGNGRLYLGVNDDFLQDNSGAFRVTVFY
ncbi:MAG: hypothetical protein U0Q11_03140 [Vicinamibacterales bacterium]